MTSLRASAARILGSIGGYLALLVLEASVALDPTKTESCPNARHAWHRITDWTLGRTLFECHCGDTCEAVVCARCDAELPADVAHLSDLDGNAWLCNTCRQVSGSRLRPWRCTCPADASDCCDFCVHVLMGSECAEGEAAQ